MMFRWPNLLPTVEQVVESFYLDADAIGDTRGDGLYHNIITEHKELLLRVFRSAGPEEENDAMEAFVHFCVANDLPYMSVYGELSQIARELLSFLVTHASFEDIPYVNDYFRHFEKKVATAYFYKFTRRLAVKNHVRLSHLANLVEKNLMVHYQHHLEWMINLIAYVEGNLSDNIAELNHTRCAFGRWLHDTTIPYLTKTSHFTEVTQFHMMLHQMAHELVDCCKRGEHQSKTVIQLLQRLDYLSLEIGNEIAVLNDMMMIEEYTKDPLTGLLTRRLFDKIVTSQIEIAKATETNCVMMMCDLDHFKNINDTYGHQAGDEVIRSFSEILQQTLRRSDFIFRFGGEEFLVLLPSTSLDEGRVVAEKIRCDFSHKPIAWDNDMMYCTVSIGLTLIDPHKALYITKEMVHDYVARADANLYLAKRNGRNRVE